MNRSTQTQATQAPRDVVTTIDYIVGSEEYGHRSDGRPYDDVPVVAGRQPERADRYDPDHARLDRDDPFAIPICRGL